MANMYSVWTENSSNSRPEIVHQIQFNWPPKKIIGQIFRVEIFRFDIFIKLNSRWMIKSGDNKSSICLPKTNSCVSCRTREIVHVPNGTNRMSMNAHEKGDILSIVYASTYSECAPKHVIIIFLCYSNESHDVCKMLNSFKSRSH